jgi:hypothetical protein
MKVPVDFPVIIVEVLQIEEDGLNLQQSHDSSFEKRLLLIETLNENYRYGGDINSYAQKAFRALPQVKRAI